MGCDLNPTKQEAQYNSDATALEYASPALKDDKQLVCGEAVEECGDARKQYASPAWMEGDKEVVLETKNGWAFQHASPALKDDEETAIQKDPHTSSGLVAAALPELLPFQTSRTSKDPLTAALPELPEASIKSHRTQGAVLGSSQSHRTQGALEELPEGAFSFDPSEENLAKRAVSSAVYSSNRSVSSNFQKADPDAKLPDSGTLFLSSNPR